MWTKPKYSGICISLVHPAKISPSLFICFFRVKSEIIGRAARLHKEVLFKITAFTLLFSLLHDTNGQIKVSNMKDIGLKYFSYDHLQLFIKGFTYFNDGSL